jgi:DNA-binding NarL/FixJ family response regulator
MPLARNPRLSALTERGRDTLDLIAEGLTNRQVAERLFMAEKTVKNYVSGLLASWTLASWIWSDALKRQIYGAQVRQEQARHEGT